WRTGGDSVNPAGSFNVVRSPRERPGMYSARSASGRLFSAARVLSVTTARGASGVLSGTPDEPTDRLGRGPCSGPARPERDDAQHRVVRPAAAAGVRPGHRPAAAAGRGPDRLLRPPAPAAAVGRPGADRRVPRH